MQAAGNMHASPRHEDATVRHRDGSRRQHVASLDYLRGIASLAVVLRHFCLIPGVPRGSWLRVADHGRNGVTIFFVISGFVLPLAMYSSGYRVRSYGRFLLKRLLRLEPPYLVSVALILVLGVYAKVLTFPGIPDHVSIAQVVLHLGYLNTYFGYDSVNQVYWTLAIEFQFYLAIGLLLPLVASRVSWIATASLTALASIALVLDDRTMVSGWLPVFALGILVFRYRVGLVAGRSAAFAFCALVAFIAVAIDVEIAVFAGVTAAVIAMVDVPETRVGTFLGGISYSLYLLHNPIGFPIIGLVARLVGGPAGTVVGIVSAVTVSIVAAALFARFIERPAQRLASRLRYELKDPSVDQVLVAPSTQLAPSFEVH